VTQVVVFVENERLAELLLCPGIVCGVCELIFVTHKHGNWHLADVLDWNLRWHILPIVLLVSFLSIVEFLESVCVKDLTVVIKAIKAGARREVAKIHSCS